MVDLVQDVTVAQPSIQGGAHGLATMTMVDGVQVVVPNSLNLITPYVLREQQDWFEDEIRFVRRLLTPGANAIDIGANHGVYTLSMAKIVGPGGQIWAFEPASGVSRLLEQSIQINEFDHVVLDRRAVSDHAGNASMAVSAASELNTLSLGSAALGATEVVGLTTLDECLVKYQWRDIDFLKIDAEGEEARILQAGVRFFNELSPLVMYEVRDGGGLHLELVQAFAALGYGSYRLVQGLGLLVPHESSGRIDDVGLNLFACKLDRAQRLASRGLLVLPQSARLQGQRDAAESTAVRPPAAAEWQQLLGQLPYAQRLESLWASTAASGLDAQVSDALALYARSRNASLEPAHRYAALRASYGLLSAASKQPSGYLRLASLARVAADLGDRNSALVALAQLCADLRQRCNVGPAEPFLAPCARFDLVAPRGALGNWVLAAALEERERLGAYSSYFTGNASWHDLKAIEALGFAGDEMLRRIDLIQRRFGVPSSPPPRTR